MHTQSTEEDTLENASGLTVEPEQLSYVSGSEEDYDDEYDEDEEDEDYDDNLDEPKLRYRRVGANVKEILEKDTASTIRVSERFLVNNFSILVLFFFIIYLEGFFRC